MMNEHFSKSLLALEQIKNAEKKNKKYFKKLREGKSFDQRMWEQSLENMKEDRDAT